VITTFSIIIRKTILHQECIGKTKILEDQLSSSSSNSKEDSSLFSLWSCPNTGLLLLSADSFYRT
jgi:hypothetical protein